MQPSEITAHQIDSIGPKLPPETHIFSLRHLTTGADILDYGVSGFRAISRRGRLTARSSNLSASPSE
jgi:hypothetical protein